MKKKGLISGLLGLCVCISGCNAGDTEHTHDYSRKAVEDQYLKAAATCTSAAEYYYSCACGEKGEESFRDGKSLGHDYTVKAEDSQYIKTEKTCQQEAEYFYSCANCGGAGRETFTVEGLGDHVFDQEVPADIYLKAEATFTSSAEYYTSCVCGLQGVNTFFYGEKLRDYTDEEKVPYTPTSLTVTLYDTENSTYGFTYNTQSKPLKPVIQVSVGENFADYQEYTASVQSETSYLKDSGESFTYYIVKAEVPLESNTTYTYRAYDKHVQVGSEVATMTTKDTKATTFTFAHVSDSQGASARFREVLKCMSSSVDFLVHTGDFVENSKWESEWNSMIHGSFNYLSKIPVMAISGNHETTYKNGNNETFKHFNNKIPVQSSTNLGYFYSFIYGNTKFIMLNTNDLLGNKLKDEQYDWLVNELENNDCTWTIVGLHNPMYSVGGYGSNPSKNQICLALREQLQSIFAQYGVDIVLQGHDHVISRTRPIDQTGQANAENWKTMDGVAYSVDPNGVIYVMNGPAGEQARSIYEEADTAMYHYAQASKARSWAEFAIEGNKMVVTVKYTDGSREHVYHTWGISKSVDD